MEEAAASVCAPSWGTASSASGSTASTKASGEFDVPEGGERGSTWSMRSSSAFDTIRVLMLRTCKSSLKRTDIAMGSEATGLVALIKLK